MLKTVIKTVEDLEVTGFLITHDGKVLLRTADDKHHTLRISVTTGLVYVDTEEKEDERKT